MNGPDRSGLPGARVAWALLALALLVSHSVEPIAFQARLSDSRDASVADGLPLPARSLLKLPRALIERAWAQESADGERLARKTGLEAARDASKHFARIDVPPQRLVRAETPAAVPRESARPGCSSRPGTPYPRAPPLPA